MKNYVKKTISPISYRLIKSYRDKYIMNHLVTKNYYSETINSPNTACNIINEAITSDRPCMISRFGSNELDATLNFRKGHPLSFLRTFFPFWVGEKTKERMLMNAGFFPNDNKSLSRFADLIINLVGDIDILGTWVGTEENLPLARNCKRVKLMYLDPFWSKEPWTAQLKDKKILVVHPFAESINNQYAQRELLSDNKDILPKFASLTVIKAVQSIGGETNGFNTWFDALNYMENEIDKVDYDVALIGCGAYGMPLAAHCKRMGKKAIHLGGTLQLMFGIRGNRWETEQDIYKQFMNEHWVRPLESERPKTAQNIENACYW